MNKAKVKFELARFDLNLVHSAETEHDHGSSVMEENRAKTRARSQASA